MPDSLKRYVDPPQSATDFVKGAASGFVKPFVELKDTAVALGSDAAWLVKHPVTAAEAPFKWLYKSGMQVYDHRGQILATAEQIWNTTEQSAQAVAGVLHDLYQNPDAEIVKLIAGTAPGLAALPGQVSKAFEAGAELLGGLLKQVLTGTDYDRGWYAGYALGTIVQLVVVDLATAGVGGVASALSKPEVLEQAAAKFIALGGPFKAAAESIADLSAGLKTTKMCFVAGTKVRTPQGLKDIETIRAGNLVLSRDQQTGEQGYKPVLQTVITHPTRLYRVSYRTAQRADATLVCTGEHPFYVTGQQKFVPAMELQPGDALSLADGADATVSGVTTEDAPGGQTFTTYNFEVQAFHTYFVGDAGVWVHNAGGLCERMYLLYAQIVDTQGLQTKPWEAFKVLLQKTAGISANIDAALPDTSAEVMKSVYSLAAGDVSKVPKVSEMADVMAGRGGNALLDMHHTVPQKWARRLLERTGLPQYQGLTAAQWKPILDDMPGMVLDKFSHGNLGDGGFHQILDDIFKTNGANSTGQILDNIQEAYT